MAVIIVFLAVPCDCSLLLDFIISERCILSEFTLRIQNPIFFHMSESANVTNHLTILKYLIMVYMHSKWAPNVDDLLVIYGVIIPYASTKLKGGYTGFTSSVRLSVCRSVCGQNHIRSVSSTIIAGSISYLHIFSSNFSRCVVCIGYCKIPQFEFLANFWKL